MGVGGSTVTDVLVLSRKAGESIVIGNEITVTVVEFRGDQVRLGIQAPRSVQVYREELYAEVSRQNREAAAVELSDLDDLPGRPAGGSSTPPSDSSSD